ncbi:MAG TPA: secretin N-terminal domain-containing protein [Phycisphaerae bacterium]|nr:secretin N-terminal domain-containing protein [Phycisphaerae bacterium]HRY66900.1 secretin N-terminal domain-containing protein [Phycisphaerae bacterium]HSA26959.1 secretin N-terminal domain-containing protein [Phycisphaerae bacterium]
MIPLRRDRLRLLLVLLAAQLGWAAAPLSADEKRPATRPAATRPAAGALSRLLGLSAARPAKGSVPDGGSMKAEAAPEDRLADDAPEPEVQVSARGTIELHVADADLSTVLKALSRQSRRNIIAAKDVEGKVTADLYDLTLEQTLDAILKANGCGWREGDGLIYVYTSEELARIQDAERPPECRVFHLKHVNGEEASKLLQPLLSKEGRITVTSKAQVGISEGDTESGGNSLANEDYLLIIDTPERLAAIARVLDEIDARPKQVLIEATILRAQLNQDNAMGIDFNIVTGVDLRMLNSVSTGVTDLTTGDVPQEMLQETNMAFREDFTSAVPAGGFTFGIIKDHVGAFVRALESVTDTTVIANPKVLALNKQRGEVIVGRRDGYLTTTVTETTATQTVQFLETGTQLIFRPFIENNGYVRMEIHPKDSSGGLTAANLPFEQTTEVTTNITVRDGHTILIGGLFREVSKAARGQIPYLGNLPLAGVLFRNTADNTQREEVIILLTVHIVKDDDQLNEESRKALENVERYRAGLRAGLQPYGRERLAQAHYHWAMQHLAKGNAQRALWDARLATHLNPMFLEAIELSERLTNERAWEADGSTANNFVLREILRTEGDTRPLHGRPSLDLPVMDTNRSGGRQKPEAKPAGTSSAESKP